MITKADIGRRVLADALERALSHETGDRVDDPEGRESMRVSATLMREIILALRGE